VGLLKNNAAAASIKCKSDMKVNVVKSQTAIPFFSQEIVSWFTV
jgi:hypothetical protein